MTELLSFFLLEIRKQTWVNYKVKILHDVDGFSANESNLY